MEKNDLSFLLFKTRKEEFLSQFLQYFTASLSQEKRRIFSNTRRSKFKSFSNLRSYPKPEIRTLIITSLIKFYISVLKFNLVHLSKTVTRLRLGFCVSNEDGNG